VLREVLREPRILGLVGLILLLVSMIIRSLSPGAAEVLWWLAFAMFMVGAVVMLNRKRQGKL
jgi:hypothetical protein